MTKLQDGLDSCSESRMFSLKSIARCGARLGTLNIPGRKPLQTPGYIAITSRGAVPHLAQDVHESSTALKGIYTALEDCK